MRCGEECDNCVYIGEGDYFCLLKEKVVIEDFAPTDKFACCGFVKKKGGDKSGKRNRGRPRKYTDD